MQRERPSLYDLTEQMKTLMVPTLILTGDEDWPCLQPALLMKQAIPSAALSVMPNCGHTINLEDPDQFNRLVGDFIAQVDAGRWPKRDPRAMATVDNRHEVVVPAPQHDVETQGRETGIPPADNGSGSVISRRTQAV